MKKLFLGLFAVGLFGSFFVQAKWVEMPYKNKFEYLYKLSVENPQSIWAYAFIKDAGTSLFKWSQVEGEFKPQKLPPFGRVFFSSIYAFDKGILALVDKELDQKSKDFYEGVADKQFILAKAELKKLLVTGEISQLVIDKFNEIVDKFKKKPMPHFALFSLQEPGQFFYPEVKEKKVLDAIRKVGELVGEKGEELAKGFVPGYVRPLKRFMNGKIEVIRDFKNLEVRRIAARNINDVWVLVSDGLPSYLEHWDGKAWNRIEGPLQFSAKAIGVGRDRSLFVFTWSGELLRWDGVKWVNIPIDVKKMGKVENFSVVNANDIWFASEYSSPKVEFATNFFHWDGKKIEKRGSFKEFEKAIVSAPGIVLIRSWDDKIYKWVDAPQRIGEHTVAPVQPAAK